MSRKAERICIGGLVLQTACALACFFLMSLTNSWAVFAEAWHFTLGIGIWLVALLHVSFRRRAAEERLDEEAIRRRQGERAEGLFGPEGAADQFSAQARLARVEKWFVPIGSLLVAVGMIALSLLMLSGWGRPTEPMARPLGGVGAFGAIVFLTFLASRFAIGQSEETDSSLLRGPGSAMLFNTLCSALVAIALTFAQFGSFAVEKVVAWIIVAALGVIGLELALTFVVNLYRPRQTGREPRAPYDSRLLGLLSMPKRVLRSAAETLDYQFGFKVSETWFFHFLERALMPLILFGLVTLYLLTCFLVVPIGHLAFVERFGEPRSTAGAPKAYGPGLYLTWPWPFEVSRVVATDRVQEVILGVSGEEVGRTEYERALARGEKAEMPPVLWTAKHFAEEYTLLVAVEQSEEGAAAEEAEDTGGLEPGAAPIEPETQIPPVSLVTVSVPVQFTVRAEQLYEYVYGYSDVAAALESVAYRELVQYVATADLLRLLGPDRTRAGDELRRRIQDAADRAQLGVDIVFVGLQNVHPPQEVAPSFEAVTGALEERHKAILTEEKAAIEKKADALAERVKILGTARAKRYQRRTAARAKATRFQTFDAADQAASGIFRTRYLLSWLEQILAERKLVLAPGGATGDEVVIINLEKKPGAGLTGVELEELLKGTKP